MSEQANENRADQSIFVEKDRYVTFGISKDFIWYESEILLREMGQWGARLDRLVKVMEERHKEHTKMIEDLIEENKKLKQQLKDKS